MERQGRRTKGEREGTVDRELVVEVGGRETFARKLDFPSREDSREQHGGEREREGKGRRGGW